MIKPTRCNTFDIDGVIYLNKEIGGLYPGPNDVIITGRSIEEEPETKKMLHARGIHNQVYFNPLPFNQKSRESSGEHKAAVINSLITLGFTVGCHFEDDEIQAAVIRKKCPMIPVVMVVHDLTTKENVRHTE